MKQPLTRNGLEAPAIADDLAQALRKLQAELDQLGVQYFRAEEFGRLWRPGWTGPSQAIPEDPSQLARTGLLLDWIREDFGKPLNAGSTFRPVEYNTADGQSPGSQHQWGRAGDPRPTPRHNKPSEIRRLYVIIMRNLEKYRSRIADRYGVQPKDVKFGLKYYRAFVHIDVSIRGEIGARTRDWLPDPVY